MPASVPMKVGKILTATATMAATAAVIQAPPGTKGAIVSVSARSTYGWCPKVRKAVFKDNTAYSDIRTNLTDADSTTTTGTTLNSWVATQDAIYIGSSKPFRGMHVDVTNTNGNASVMTVKYLTADGTFADITATDGTASAGATLAQDGLITWTLPTSWAAFKASTTVAELSTPMFWVEVTVSANLDATVSIAAITLLQDVAPTAESIGYTDPIVFEELDEVGGIEHLDAGTGTIDVMWLLG